MSTYKWPAPARPSKIAGSPARLRLLQRGIRFVLGGYLLATLVALPAAVLWLTTQPDGWLDALAVGEDARALALRVASVSAVLAFVLVARGQWGCLRHAPPGHGSRKWAFVSGLLALVVPGVAVAAGRVGELGEVPWVAAFLANPLQAPDWEQAPAGELLQLLGAVLAVGYLLSFSQFVRTLFLRIQDEERAGRIEVYFLGVCLVVGGSLGLALAPPEVRTSELALAGLATGWVLVLGWHVKVTLRACWYGRLGASPKASGQRAPAQRQAEGRETGRYQAVELRLR
jgi:hypothetical protein